MKLTFYFRSLWKLICIPICLSLTACGGGGFIISSVFAVLILAAIGDGGGDDNKGDPTPTPASTSILAATNLTAIPGETGIRLGWTNPDRDNIVAFNISRQEMKNPTTRVIFRIARANPMNVSFTRGATTSFVIDGLDIRTNYNLGVLVMYVDGSTAQSAEILVATGINSDNDSEIDFFDDDDDNDGVEDGADNCPIDPNPQQADVNKDGEGDACETAAEKPAIGGVINPVITPGETVLFLNWTNPVALLRHLISVGLTRTMPQMPAHSE